MIKMYVVIISCAIVLGCMPAPPQVEKVEIPAVDPFPASQFGHLMIKSFSAAADSGLGLPVTPSDAATIKAHRESTAPVSSPLARRIVITYDRSQLEAFGAGVRLLQGFSPADTGKVEIVLEDIRKVVPGKSIAWKKPYFASEIRAGKVYLKAYAIDLTPFSLEQYRSAGLPDNAEFDAMRNKLLAGQNLIVGYKIITPSKIDDR